MPTLGIAIDARKATIGAEEATKAVKKIRRETGQLDRAQKKLAHQMNSTGVAAKGMGGMLSTAFAGLGVAAAIGKMVRTISSLDEAMARLQGVTGRTSEQMEILESTARRLGATTSFTAGEAADGMLMLARAGLTANEVVKATGPVLDLAKVAGVGLELSSTLLADSLKMFGMEAAFAAQAADQLTMASNSTNTSIEQLSEGLKLAGPVAHAAGIDMAETSAILGILADNGLKATLGGTGLRAVLASLAQPSTAATKTLQKLGVDTEKLTKKIQTRGGLLEVMSKLGPETMDMADAIEIFSRRGASAALTLARNTKKWSELTAQITDANGVTRESAALIEDTLGDSFRTLMSAVDELILSIGESGFTGAVKSMVRFVTDGVRALTSFDTGLTRSGAAAAAMIAALAGGAALSALNRLRIALMGIVKGPMALIKAHPIMAAVSAVTLLVEGFIMLADKTRFTTEELKKFNDAVKASSQQTASISEQFVATEMFGGERMLEGRIKAFSAMQAEAINLIGLLKTLGKTQDSVSRDRISGFGDDMRRMGMNVPVELNRPNARARAQGFNFVNIEAAIEKLRQVVLRLDPRIERARQNMKRIQSPETESAAEPSKPDPAMQKMASVRQMIDEVMKGLREETVLLGIELKDGADKAEEAAEVMRLRNSALAEGVQLHYAQEEALREQVRALQDAQKALEDKTAAQEAEKIAIEGAQARAQNTKLLTIELEKGARAAEIEGAVMEEKNRLAEMGLRLSDEQRQAIEDDIKAHQKLTDQLTKQAEEKAALEGFADTIAMGLVSPLRNALLSGDFSRVGQQMFMNLSAAILDEMAIKPLVGAIKTAIIGASQADGGAWSGGVQRFAKGGVVGEPTTFGMAGNRIGLMGEAGPEAIMPLKRLPSGRLGIEAQGGGTTINDNRRITIQVKDDSGMRRTMRQMDRDTARRIDEGMN